MKQKFLCLAALCFPFLGVSQAGASGSLGMTDNRGIKWVEGLSWQQVKAKAKKENKYIFVDCFTTWCKPCKQMDKEVYTVDSVGDFLNKGFISVKLQMDVTKNDNAAIKSWYKTANEMGNKYRIAAYPSYIFFAPNGELVSKDLGYKDATTFMKIARDAKDPSKLYYLLLKNYKKGKKHYAHMPYLINTSKQLGDTSTYNELLSKYYSYLHALPKEKRYTKDNIEFVASTLDKSSQVVFDMFFPNGNEVNKVMKNDWYAKKLVDKIIIKEKVNPFLQAVAGKSVPDWNALYNSIEKKYDADYAGRNVLIAKITWHGQDEDPLIRAILYNDKMEKYGSDTTSLGEDFILNNRAYGFFERLTDTVQLKRIIGWMEGVARRGEKATGVYFGYWPTYLDTYANLLYKVGRTREAIEWQELAMAKGKERSIGKGSQKAIEGNLELMKQGKPTW